MWNQDVIVHRFLMLTKNDFQLEGNSSILSFHWNQPSITNIWQILYTEEDQKKKLKDNILKMGASVVWFSPFYSLKRLFNWVSMILHQVFVFTMNISTILIFASYPLINSHRNLYLNPMRCKKNLIVAKILIYSKTSIIYSFSTAKRLKSTMNINI